MEFGNGLAPLGSRGGPPIVAMTDRSLKGESERVCAFDRTVARCGGSAKCVDRIRYQPPPDGGADVVSGTSGVGVGDDPAPAGGKPPRARGVPESGGKMVGASGGVAPLGVPGSAVPGAVDALLAGTPMSGGIEAGDGVKACDGNGELDTPEAGADTGADTGMAADAEAADADTADAEADADAASDGATALTGGA